MGRNHPPCLKLMKHIFRLLLLVLRRERLALEFANAQYGHTMYQTFLTLQYPPPTRDLRLHLEKKTMDDTFSPA